MNSILIVAMTLSYISCYECAVIEPGFEPVPMTKVFNYEGSLPIRDDRTGEIIATADDSNNSTITQEDQEECWKLVVEESEVTFALQNKVLDELDNDLKLVKVDQNLINSITNITTNLRNNLREALDALKTESAAEYFEFLFGASENIVQLSSTLRTPKLDDDVFLALVKAVSRLSRNNSNLIQEFMSRCSVVINNAPLPRALTSSLE